MCVVGVLRSASAAPHVQMLALGRFERLHHDLRLGEEGIMELFACLHVSRGEEARLIWFDTGSEAVISCYLQLFKLDSEHVTKDMVSK